MAKPVDPLLRQLRARRLELRMTQLQVARLLGHTDKSAVSNMERGCKSPTLWTLRRWTTALGMDLVPVSPIPPPVELPDVDEVAVERACRGQDVVLNAAERQLAVAKLTDRGMSAREIAEMLSCAPRTVVRERARRAQAVDNPGKVA